MTIAALHRRAKVVATLLTWLDAGFTKPRIITEKKPKTRPARKRWRTLYNWWFELVPKKGTVINSEGFTPETKFDLVRKFSHQPGDIIVSRARKSTKGDLVRYIVNTDFSLRRITA